MINLVGLNVNIFYQIYTYITLNILTPIIQAEFRKCWDVFFKFE